MLYIAIVCIFCRFFGLLTIKIFFPKKCYAVELDRKIVSYNDIHCTTL